MKKIIFLGFGFLLLLIFSCKKDPPLPNDCIEIPANSPATPFGGGWKIDQPQYNYQVPCFNPNNTDEFVFVREDFINQQAKLMKYNILSKELTELTAKTVWFQPSWSTMGWIAFTSNDKQVWQVNEIGDSLSQLTFNNENGYPDWSPVGDYFIIRRRKGSSWPNHVIIDRNGVLLTELDTLLSYFSPKWSPDSSKIFGTNGSRSIDVLLYYYLCDGKIIEVPISFSGKNWINPYTIDWFPDSERVIWADNEGSLYVTNIHSYKTIKIKQGCDNRYYGYMSVSPDGSKIISERTDQRVIDDETKFIEKYLVIMNADGSGEERIDIK